MKIRRFLCSCSVLVLASAIYGEELKLGKPLDVEEVTSIEDLLSRPEDFVGKTVKIEGRVTEVCNMMQCWVKVREAGSGKVVQVKVNDGEIVFPKDSVGKHIIAQGKVTQIPMTRDQYIASLKHEAEEQGKSIDVSTITEGKTIYRIQGQGAVIR